MIYKAFGLTIKSEIDIPEFIESDGEADVTITLGKVEPIYNPIKKGARFEAKEGEFVLWVDNIAKFRVEGGKRIIVEMLESGDNIISSMRLFLLGSVFSALIYQRGELALHSSAIAYGGKAYLFMGVSGAGKSTTVGLLKKRGYEVLSDDVCLVKIIDSIPYVVPGFPSLKLWEDALGKIGIKEGVVVKLRDEISKYRLNIGSSFCQTNLPLGGVIHLKNHNQDDMLLEQVLDGPSKLKVLIENTYRSNYLKGLNMEAGHFISCTTLASKVKFSTLTRPRGRDTLGEVGDIIEGIING